MTTVSDRKINDNRIALYDNVKFLMIVLVVVGHMADNYTAVSEVYRSVFLFIYSFHMPVLLFISGLFYSNKRNAVKILYYICGGFAMKILFSLTDLIFTGKTSFSLLSDGGVPWFLFVLAIYQLLMYVFNKGNINKTFLLVFCVILACFAGYDSSVGDFLYLSRTIIFFPFYLLGATLTHSGMTGFINKKSKWLIVPALAVLIGWLILCFVKGNELYFLRYLFTGRNPFSDETLPYGFIYRLLCYAISFITGASIFILVPKFRIPFFTRLGSKTLNVYFWHCTLLFLLEHFCHISDLFGIGYMGKIVYLLIGVVISILLAWIKVFDYPLNIVKKVLYNTKLTTGK